MNLGHSIFVLLCSLKGMLIGLAYMDAMSEITSNPTWWRWSWLVSIPLMVGSTLLALRMAKRNQRLEKIALLLLLGAVLLIGVWWRSILI